MIRLVSISPNCESTIVYCARVSSNNQENPEIQKLIRYCVKNGHWSIFEMGNMIVEVEAPRYITAQILRHRSFSFQEFSQRYAVVNTKEDRNVIAVPQFREKKTTNRQSSQDIHPNHHGYLDRSVDLFNQIYKLYDEMIENGVACETARTILPLCTMSKIYMNGTIRSWIHYLQIRCTEHTQHEHRVIALEIKKLFQQQLPTIYAAVFSED